MKIHLQKCRLLLRQIIGNRAWRTTDRTWETPASGEVLRADGMQTAATYIFCSHGKVVQWVYLLMIFEVCTQEQGFEGRRRWRRPWWEKKSPEGFAGPLCQSNHGRLQLGRDNRNLLDQQRTVGEGSEGDGRRLDGWRIPW